MRRAAIIGTGGIASAHVRAIRDSGARVELVAAVDVDSARVYGKIEAALSGKGLADADLQIAASAIVHGLELVTGNIKHFSRISTPDSIWLWPMRAGNGRRGQARLIFRNFPVTLRLYSLKICVLIRLYY